MRTGLTNFAKLLLIAAVSTACSSRDLDPAPDVIVARFDPDDKAIPMPTDVLRDDVAGRLDLPVDDDDLSAAEREFYQFLNTLDGWSSAMSATVEFSGAIDPGTVNDDTIEVWHFRETPTRVLDVRLLLNDSETELTIEPPRTGWERGGKYVVLLRGGEAGLEGKRGESVIADAAFYFLRLQEALDTPEHARAFPGETAAEREENARDLEEIRLELAPYFDFFEARGVERDSVASLFSFTITERVELAMDKASQRMPLPIDLLIDPATGRVDLPPADWDTTTVLEAKERLAEYDGFGISSKLMFGFTGPIDRATVDDTSVRLYRIDGEQVTEVPATVVVLDDGINVELEPIAAPLAEQSRYAVAVADTVLDIGGEPVIKMPIGHFLQAESTMLDGGSSLVGPVDDDEALRLERVRTEVAPLVNMRGRDALLAAWSYTTMSIEQPLRDLLDLPVSVAATPDPTLVTQMTPGQALLDFPFALGSLFNVEAIYHGTIKSPVYLDSLTRGWRGDGGHEVQDINFTMTLPDSAQPGDTIPVVIFGHGVMTERRFVLAVGSALAARGFAAVSVDFPYHGDRTYCFSEGPISIPNPTTGQLTPLGNPCADGGVCQPDGSCLATDGTPGELSNWPIIGMRMSSGAAFLEIEHIANTRDHFRQSLIDLASLERSLREGDWESVVGVKFDTSNIHYAGQSLGGIIGATFVALRPRIKRAVLNVPGADTVDLFDASLIFGPQVAAFFNREGVERESFDGHRFLNVGRWLMDSVDPASFAGLLRGRNAMVQMATLDFIIPNEFTLTLEQLSGLPRRDYIGEHAFLTIPGEPAFFRGNNEMADFLAGEFTP